MTLGDLVANVSADLYRHTGRLSVPAFLRHALLTPGFKVTLWFRICAYVHESAWRRTGAGLVARLIRRHYAIKYGADLPYQTRIGPGLFIAHVGGIYVNARASIGANCNLGHGVTVGESNRGARKGVPVIGDNVYIGPGAKLFGSIHVGSHVAVGANCVVTKDVADHAVVVGVPARVISHRGSRGYINKIDYADASRGQVIFFWDYDTQWGADRSRRGFGALGWGEDEFTGAELLLELHARAGVRACFAVVGAASLPGERPYHDPAQIRRIHGSGHEIASHSQQHEFLPSLSSGALRATLTASKDALEQCIGAPVTTFVPPYNQPFDYPAALSISLAERRAARDERTDLPRLCAALREADYRFCRVSYRPAPQRVAELITRRRLDRPVFVEQISGLTCVRLNTPGGFTMQTRRVIDRCAERGGTAVVYGHPHSVRSGNSQDARWLVPLLEHVAALRDAGRVRVVLPRELTGGLERS
jgi:serine O-acetyltransferase